MSGYIKIHRNIQKWGWWESDKHLRVFLDILFNAQYHDGEYMGVKLKPGMLSTSVNAIKNRTRLSVQSVRTVIRDLISTNEITIKTTSKCSIITITKWKEYQVDDKPTNNHLTNSQQTTNNLQEGKKVKKERSIVEVPSECSEIIDFLNSSAGTKYKASSKETASLIKARINDGFTVSDFKRVIENQCRDWLEDKKMQKFLRPSTLFGSKFEGYLNAPKIKTDQEEDEEFLRIVLPGDRNG